MGLQTEQSGTPSRIFGDRFPYPLDGKSILLEIADVFAREFNRQARVSLPPDVRAGWQNLSVSGAYPTTRQQCPRITVVRNESTSKIVGLGAEVETYRKPGQPKYRVFKGQTITDTIGVDILTLNEIMRDELFIWFQQYVFDATAWLLTQMNNVYGLQCTTAVDDQGEYEGTAAQPGFQFYVARFTFKVTYDMLVLENVDTLKEMVNWQAIAYANLPSVTNTITFGASNDDDET